MSVFSVANNRICSSKFKPKTNGSQVSGSEMRWHSPDKCHYTRATAGESSWAQPAPWSTRGRRTSAATTSKAACHWPQQYGSQVPLFSQECLADKTLIPVWALVPRKVRKLSFSLLLSEMKIHTVGKSPNSGCPSSARGQNTW